MNTEKTIVLKVFIIGDGGVGKTSLLNRFIKKTFSYQYKTTLDAYFLSYDINLDGTVVQLQLSDTIGQERYGSCIPDYISDADYCVLCFDLTDLRTFEKMQTLGTEILTKLNPKDPENFPFVVIGNKCDKNEGREVSESDVKKYCSDNGILKYYETSAKDNVNVDKAFEEVALAAYTRRLNCQSSI